MNNEMIKLIKYVAGIEDDDGYLPDLNTTIGLCKEFVNTLPDGSIQELKEKTE